MPATDVVILLGSKSDLDHVAPTRELLDNFGIGYEVQVISAHRQPQKLHEYIQSADANGVKVYIAAAGLSAALPGVIGSLSNRPVIGVPVPGGALKGIDALLSMAQMPGGIPVATVGIGSNGSKNAAILAAQILALSDESVRAKLHDYREGLKEG